MVISAPPATAATRAALPHPRRGREPRPPRLDELHGRAGDTLVGIAARFRTTVGVLAARNEVRNRTKSGPGRTLTVPRTGAAKAPRGAGAAATVHVVRAGDTLVRHRRPLPRVPGLAAQGEPPLGRRVHPPRPEGRRRRAPRARGRRPHPPRRTPYRVRAGDTLGGDRGAPPHLGRRHRQRPAALQPRADPPGPAARLPGAAAASDADLRARHVRRREVPPGRRPRPPPATGRSWPGGRCPSRSETKAMIVADRPQARGRHPAGPGDRLPGVGLEPARGLPRQRRRRHAGHPAGRRVGLELVGRRLDLLKTQDNITAGVVMLRALRTLHRQHGAGGRGLLPGPGRAAAARDVQRHQGCTSRNVMALRRSM